jgi:hypothetical protein
MKSRLFLVSLISLFPELSFGQESFSWNGFWKGDISVMGSKIGVIIEVVEKSTTEKSDKTEGQATVIRYKSTLDVPMQGARGIAVSKTEVNNRSIVWEIDAIGARCIGQRKDSFTIEAQWTQGGKTLPLTLRWTSTKYLTRYQTPKAPFGYGIRAAQFSHPLGKLIFGGTLTIPNDSLLALCIATNPGLKPSMMIESKPTVIRKEKRGEIITEITDGVKKYPAVLLLSGSGSQDRDETIADHKPFAVWADYLSRSGIAVLRVDDRGMGASKGQPEFLATTTTESYVDDALAALQWLKQQPDIDTNFIFLMGHSEGANVAIKTAAKETNIRGVISLAGMTSSGIETTLFQLQPIWRKNTTDEKTLSELASITRRMATASKYYNSVSSAKKFVKDSLLKIESSRYKLAIAYLKKYDMPNSGKKDLATMLAYQIGEAYQNPWIQYYLHYDPKPEYMACSPALLMVQGGKDIQINPKATKALVNEMTKQGKYVSLLEFGGLNHLFQHTQTGEVSEYFTLEETLALEVQAGVLRWLTVQLSGR